MADKPYNIIYGEGDHLILELRNEMIFEGDYCSSGSNNIELINVKQHNNPNALGGIYSFNRCEIACIYYLKDSKVEKRFKRYKRSDVKEIDLTQAEYNRFFLMTRNYVYIQRADTTYYKAVQKLQEAENIGIIPLGLKPSKSAQIILLAICTWKEVFLFDLADKKNRYFYPELKEVFESEYTCKVLHSGSPLIDILFRNYNVYMENTFDTQVVDLILQKSKTGKCPDIARTFSECLIEYINLPTSFLSTAMEVSEKVWQERPLRNDQLHLASQLVTYILIVKHKMERLLCSETYATICKVNHFYSELLNQELITICENGEVSENLAQLVPSLGQPTVNAKPDTEEETN